MTKSDFQGAGLTEDQWSRLKSLATSLTPEQANWVGGYFTGYAEARRSSDTAPAIQPPMSEIAATRPAQRTLAILYASETGNGLSLGEELAADAIALGLPATAVDLADYRTATLRQEQDLLIITSTHGEGEPPQPALGFFEFLDSRKSPRLEGVRFAIMALGDSTYEFYCEAGKRLDRRLEELGAERLAPRIDCDVDELKAGKAWATELLAQLARTGAENTGSVPAVARAAPADSAAHDADTPFYAEVMENLVITGRGSSKETRHIEISLGGSGLTYEPGDALGLVTPNEPALVREVLDCLGFDGDQPVLVDQSQSTLGAALSTAFEIVTATPRFLSHWAEVTGATELAQLAGPDRASERAEFLRSHHVVDIVRRFPAGGIAPSVFTAALRAMQPRLYSIASSQDAQGGDAHLTVSTVRYRLHETDRWGVASGWLARHIEPGATLPVHVKANPHFRLPASDVPIIMVGAGTGVAPYRAFVQQREIAGAKGRSWLFFGDRNFRSDFLYQAEWQQHLKTGALTFMDVAFSRDRDSKTYVQHRLLERAPEVYAWLEDGAHFYVCGDAKAMAPDVHRALVSIVAQAGGHAPEAAEDYVRTLQRDGRYQRDVY